MVSIFLLFFGHFYFLFIYLVIYLLIFLFIYLFILTQVLESTCLFEPKYLAYLKSTTRIVMYRPLNV